MNTTPETSGYFMPGRKETLSKAPSAMVAYSTIHFITYKKVVMKKMILKSAILAMVLLFASIFFVQKSFAQGTMGRWEMCGLSGTPATVTATGTLAHVTFSTLTRGAGLTAASASNGFNSSGFSTASSLDITQNDYYEFTITPDPGYKMSITALKIRDQVSTTSSSFDAYVRYGDDAYGSNLSNWPASTTATNHNITLSGNAALQNRTTAVTFRIYGSDAAASGTTYRLDCLSTGFRGVDVDGSVTQLAYASQLVSMSLGSTSWCAGEARNVTVQIKNVGSAAWTDGGGNDFNVGVKWNASGANWTDYHVRVDAQNLAPGATGTYVFPMMASNNIGAGFTTPLSAGTNNLTFDVVWEGVTWFGGNNGGVGPGNTAFTSAAQTILALPTISKGANPTVCQGSTTANLSYSATTGTPNQYSIDYDAAANLAGFVDVVNAALPATPIVMAVPAGVAAGTYNGTLTVRNSTGNTCSSAGQAIAVTVTARPTITPGTNPTVCRGTTSALLSYTATNSPNQYSIDYDPTANAAGFADVTNAALPGSNITIVIPAAAAADVYNATLTVRNTTTGCVSTVSNITVTVQAPLVSFTGSTSICIGEVTTLFPSSGGTWVSNSPSIASVDNDGNVTGLAAGSATFTFTETATGCSSTTGGITVNGNATLALTSAGATTAQTKCINNAITNITYLVGGTGTGASATGLPTGVTGSYNSGTKVFTISGAPTVAGSYSYTVNTTGPCTNPSLGGTIDVIAASGISRTSAAGTDAQTKCINNAITDITYVMSGTATSISITAGALPAGVTGSFDGISTFTITGAPTVAGTFNYTVSTAGPCPLSLNGTITVTGNATLALTSAGATTAQTVCINNAVTNITYLVGGTGTGASATGLPTGVTGTYNSGTKVFTISGTPTVAGSFSYTVTTTGPCVNPSLGGTIDVTAASGISRTSAAGTDAQTKCINNAITNITYAMSGTATSISITAGALPAGVTGSFDGISTFTISGTATVSGNFSYTVSTAGPCPLSLNGTITVTANATLSFTSAAGTDAQTKCINTAITNITYLVGGSGTGASATGLPTGVTGAYNSGTKVFTISGTPSVAGTFNYTVNSAGPCVNPSLGGTITVSPNATITLTSLAGTNIQTRCQNAPITDIAYTVGGSATGANASGLPAGLNTSFSAGVFTISGAPTAAAGTYNFTVTTVSPCVNASLTGTITVNDLPASLSITPGTATICIGSNTGLTADATSGGSTAISSDNFNGTPTYTTTGSVTGNGSQTWAKENSGSNVNGVATFTSPNGGGTMVAVSAITSCFSGTCTNTASTILTSAAINTNNYTSLNISYYHTYKQGTISGSGKVEISTDNVNWTTLKTFSTNQGSSTAYVADNITLANTYLNQSNLRIRFNFVSSGSNGFFGTNSAWWAVDDVAVNGAPLSLFSWTANTAPGVNGLPAGAATPSTANKNISVNPTATTTYTLIAQNQLTGCSASGVTAVVTVNQNSTISLTSGAATQVACNNSPINAVVYTIGGGGNGAGVTGLPPGVTGLYNAGVFTISGTPTSAGTYHYTVTTTGPCNQATANGTITVGAIPTATFTKNDVSSCGSSPDAIITVTPTGGTGPYTFSWTGMTGVGAHTAYTAGNTNTVSGLDIGYYNVSFTDANGCTGTITGIHIQYAFSSYITNNGSISAGCANTGSIILYANAGVTPYSFSLDGTSYQSGNTFTNLAAGNYTAYVKDGAGCVITKPIFVAAAPPVIVNPFMRPASGCGNDGSIEIYRTGGIPPYQYSLDGINYQVGNIYNNLPAGPYTAYVKDSKGCIGVTPVTITQGASLGVAVSKTLVSTCVNDGQIQATPTGGTGPYTYSLDDVTYQPGNSFGGLAAGNYTVWVKDFRGCKGFRNVILNLNLIGVTYYVTDASDCSSSNGTIQLFRTGGVGPYTYSIDGNTYQSSPTFPNLPAGTYDGFVKDSKTCIGATFNIEVGPGGCGSLVSNNSKGVSDAPKTLAVKVAANSVLKVSAYPNPSDAGFTLNLEGGTKEKIVITVTDLVGRKVYLAEGDIKKQYKFGNNFIPGMYILQVVQGNDKQSIKLIKE